MAQYIPAFVIEKNDNVFINSSVSIGAIMEVPTPENGGFIDCDVWAVPVNEGVYAGFNYLPYNLNNPAENVAPNAFSVAVVRISSTKSSDWYIILGTSALYVAAAAGGTPLPVVWPKLSHTLALLPTCQTMNQTDANGNYIATLGLPNVTLNHNLFPFGFINGFALPAATANGYGNTVALLAFLNTATTNSGTATAPIYAGGWAIVGTWTVTSDGITLTATQASGSGTDIFCGDVILIQPSA